MNFRLCVFLILFALNMNAQQEAPPVPETWETDVWISNDWTHVSTVDYTFNTNCFPVLGVLQTLDFPTNQFINSALLTISYNASSQMTTSTNQLWNTNLQEWVNDQRSDFTYLGSNLAQVEILIWENDAWRNNERILNGYNASDLLVETIYQDWDVGSNSWINTQKNEFTYNANSSINTVTNSQWVNGNWVNNAMTTYVYNVNDLVDSEITEDWESNQWVNNNIETYTYDSNGFLIESLKSDWNSTSSTYDPDRREFYTNNSEGYPLVVVTQAYFFGSWLNTNRDRRSYPSCNTLNNVSFTDEEFLVYPNPATSELNIETQSSFKGMLEIIDINGRLVHTQKWSNELETIDVSILNAGLYMLKLSDDKSVIIKKIIKK